MTNMNEMLEAHPAYQLDEPALTRTETAFVLGVSVGHLRRLGLPQRRVGRRVLYTLAGLRAHLQQRKNPAKPLHDDVQAL